MSDPWLTIVGLGEDGPAGLPEASRAALSAADVIFGGPRHLALVNAGARGRDWPVPFKIDPVLAEAGRKVVVLASGDPFWFGAGGSLAQALPPGEWTCHPAPSTFSHSAARMGWRIEETFCFGLHAAPFERLRPVLTRGQRLICLMRDGAAVGHMADWLTKAGFGPSTLTVLEALGGPRERVRKTSAEGFALTDVTHPVALAIEAAGARGLSRASGLADDLFETDGVMTKRPVRALTLSALAPRPGEVLWDLGAGSGSISVEWCLAAPGTRAQAVEARADRAAIVGRNARSFGIDHRLTVTTGEWREMLGSLAVPDAVFIGGGADLAGIETIFHAVPEATRIVANAVTLESEAVLVAAQDRFGGTLLRIDLAMAGPLGQLRGWNHARPVVQWSAET
ncbi:precorrin-6y C5,15-methyltransferase (decarboxylating) subunit CbiE [Frigidibacter sp. RF13]|uniref:precorrin-6y C5,15-methyltransferase (decarboxylating) subunit CbiE n=1 Tax=Frigidibacter sp. RF13 TaxID=2997340 RepID=UPI00226ECAD9|nr:precorrin-6y C5,15-methyltransferase (decarboxylating) subunit CbiE [Frigidibacter sp. RF13]MCY1128358.1 precorrin-6y C5,15-methyltransferase (decarboxylating) subunit CbiE [Frigidibacter sp. RF13]